MSMTKSYYHEEITAQTDDFNEAEYWASFEPETDETEIDWFPDFRLAHDGYEEFDCELCGKPNSLPFPHKGCHDQEQAWSDAASDAFAENQGWRYLNEIL